MNDVVPAIVTSADAATGSFTASIKVPGNAEDAA